MDYIRKHSGALTCHHAPHERRRKSNHTQHFCIDARQTAWALRDSLERLYVGPPASSRLTLVRQELEHPESRDIGVFFEIVNKEVDLFGQAARLFQHLTKLDRELFCDCLAELLAAPKMLVGRTAIEAARLATSTIVKPSGPCSAKSSRAAAIRAL